MSKKAALAMLFLAVAAFIVAMTLLGCGSTRPLPMPQYKNIILSGWAVDNPNEIRNFVLMYSTDQNTWTDIKTIFPTNKTNYLDTSAYKAGYYRWRFNLLSDTSLLSNIGNL